MQRPGKTRDNFIDFIRGMLIATVFSFLSIASVQANPVLNNVAAGSATISQTPTTTTVNQTSQKAILNWDSFNIGVNESTHFQQPAGGVALNRISASQGASQIYGHLTATGQIILVNPAGIFFGPSAYVNVGGIIASTANLTDHNFLNGIYRFDKVPGYQGSIINQGTIIAAQHGLVALLGGAISNEGYVEAELGNVVLGSGAAFTLSFTGNDLVSFTVDEPTLEESTPLTNTGELKAAGGKIMITASAASEVIDSVINLGGLVEAQAVGEREGQVIISSDPYYFNYIDISGAVMATGLLPGQHGGNITITGHNILLASSANIDVSGDAGGGNILIGGNYQGKGPLPNSNAVVMLAGATLAANAVTSGDGGQVIVWSDEYTKVAGSISAKGGSESGNGGFIETSSKQLLDVNNIQIDTSATNGSFGMWLLDPTDVIISTAADSNATYGGGIYQPTDGTQATSYINTTNLQNQLASTNVTVTTTPVSGSGGGGSGDITVSDPITWGAATTLLLSAVNNIIINAAITATSGTLQLQAGTSTKTVTTGASGTINVANFNLLRGIWSQVSATLPSFTVSNNFQINSGSIPNTNARFLRAAGGDGSSGDPYQIVDLYGLQGIGSDSTTLGYSYVLNNAIDASSTSNWNGGEGWQAIGIDTNPFTGNFDGNLYAISDLYIHNTSTAVDYASFFGYAQLGSNEITEVNLKNLYLYTRGFFSGGIIAYLDTGTLSYSQNSGDLIQAHSNYGPDYSTSGGLVGTLDNATITNSFSSVNLTQPNDPDSTYPTIGGITGNAYGSTVINNSYYTGNITVSYGVGDTGYAGGLVGFYYLNDNVIENNYVTGRIVNLIEPNYHIGGLIGWTYNATTNINYNFWDSQTTGVNIASGQGGSNIQTSTNFSKTTTEMFSNNSPATYTNWDFTTVWNIIEDQSYPYLRHFYSATPRVISGLAPSTAAGADTVLISNGSIVDTVKTGNNGFYYFIEPNGTIADSDNLLVFLDSASDKANAFTIAPASGGSISGTNPLDFTTAGAIQIGNSDANTITTALLNTAKGSLTDTDILFSVSSGNLTIGNGTNTNIGLITSSATTYNLDGDISVFSGSTGSMTFNGPVLLPADRAITTESGNITFNNTVDSSGSSHALTLTSSGIEIINGIIGGNLALSSLTTDAPGTVQINANVTTAGPQTYNDAITFGSSDITLLNTDTASDITLDDATWAGTNLITISSARDIILNGAISNTAGGSLTLLSNNSDTGTGTISGLASAESGSLSFTGNGSIVKAFYNLAANPAFDNVTVTGTGSAFSAYLLIHDVLELQDLQNNLSGTYALAHDIDASDTTTWNAGAGFIPIGTAATPFTGSFDGQGYVIDGLYINASLANVGLFGFINSTNTIENVGLTNVAITNTNTSGNTGALAGRSIAATINNTYSSGNVAGSGQGGFTGGFIGLLNSGTVYGSYTTADVTAQGNAGVLVGGMSTNGFLTNSYSNGSLTITPGPIAQSVGGLVGVNDGTISNSYSLSNVTFTSYGNSWDLGGLVGYHHGGSISNTYASGMLSNADYLGGIVGSGYISSGTIADSFWDVVSTGTTVGLGFVGGIPITGSNVVGGCFAGSGTCTQATLSNASNSGTVTPVNLSSAATYAAWDISSTPSTTSTAPSNTWFIFNTKTRPTLMMEYSTNLTNGHQLQLVGSTLGADYTVANNIDLSTGMTNAADIWGTNSGTTTGRGFAPIGSISNGFTGSFDGQYYEISNLYMNQTGMSNAGLFSYVESGSTVSNLGLANANMTFSGGSITNNGTLVGQNSGTLTNVWSRDLSLTSTTTDQLGGLVGINSGTITNAWTTGTITGYANVGGLVGNNAATISNAWSSVNITATNDDIGGLVGILSTGTSTLDDSYALGNVSGRDFIGGLIGYANIGSVTTDSYSTGSASSNNSTEGGFVGYNNGATFNNNFWDTDTSGLSNAYGAGTAPSGITDGCFTGTCTNGGTANLSSATTFSNAGWDITSTPSITTSAPSNTWFIFEGSTRPLLITEWNTDVRTAHQLQLTNAATGANYSLVSDVDLSTILSNAAEIWGGINDLSVVSLSGTGNLTLSSGTFTFNNLNASNFQGIISGAGDIVKAGSATLTLSGVNTYTGTTTISAGTLQLGASGVIPDTSNLTITGTFDLNDFNETVGSVAGSGNITLGTGTLTTSSGSNTTFSGVISETGSLTKAGNGTLTLSGSNTYTGTTTINTGLLSISSSNSLGNGSNHTSGVTVTSTGASLQLAGVTITPAIPLTLNGTGISSNGALVSTGTSSYAGAITLNSNSSINSAGTLTLSGAIGGSDNFTSIGSGTLILSNISNNYSGATAINAGTLQLGASGVIPDASNLSITGTLDLNDFNETVGSISGAGNITLGSGTLTTSSSSNTTFSGVISETGNLIKAGTGILTLSGNNSYSGGTTLQAGTLRAGHDNAFGTGSFTFASGGTGTLGFTANRTLANVFVYTGDAIIDLLNISSEAVLSGTSSGSGQLTLTNSGSATSNDLQLSNSSTRSGNTIVNNNAMLLLTNSTAAGSGDITVNSGGSLWLANAVTVANNLTLNGAGYSGFSPTGALYINSSSDNTYTGSLTLGSDATIYTGGTGGQVISGAIALGSHALTSNNNNTLYFNGLVSGTGSIIKSGSGALVFDNASANNSYSGGTTVNAGTLIALRNNMFGTGDVTVNSGGSVSIGSGATIANNLFINGAGNTSDPGAISLYSSASNFITGNITLQSDSTIYSNDPSGTDTLSGQIDLGTFTLTLNALDDFGINGAIIGTGNLIKTGTNFVYLGGINTYTGTTTINQGMLQIRAYNNLADTSNLIIASGATFDLNDYIDTIGSISGAGNLWLGDGTLTTSSSSNTTFSGVITGSSASSFIKAGSGTLTLFGVNTYLGSTTINAGTLQLGASGVIPDTSNLSITGTFDMNDFNETVGSIAGAGNITLGSGTLTTSSSNDSTFSGVISETGNLIKAGSSTLTLSGNNSYSGTTTISAGTLQLGASNVIPDASDLTIAGTFDLNDFNETVGSIAGAGNITLGSGILTTSSSSNTTFSGVISETGSIVKAGSGTLTLSGNNSYSGSTTINAGTLQLGASGVIPDASNLSITGTFDLNDFNETVGSISGSGNITLGSGTLTTSSSNDSTFSGVISETGHLIKAGSSTLTLSGNNTYTGTTTINAGSLSIGSNNSLGNGSNHTSGVTVTSTGASLQLAGVTITPAIPLTLNGTGISSNGALVSTGTSSYAGAITLNSDSSINSAGTLTLSGAIGGTGSLTKLGSGTLTLSGASNYSGTTNLNAGTIVASNNTALGIGTFTGLSSTTLQIADGITLANALSIQGTGTSGQGALLASGTGTSGGAVTLAGATTLGTLTGSDVLVMNGTINGAYALTLAGSGSVRFNGTVGGTSAPTSLTSNTSTTLAANVTTSGNQTFNNALALAASVALNMSGNSNASITIGNGISGTFTAALSGTGTANYTFNLNGNIGSNVTVNAPSSSNSTLARTSSNDTTWNITGSNAGNATASGITGSLAFTNIKNITAPSNANNTFTFSNGASMSGLIDASNFSKTNILDFNAYTSAINITITDFLTGAGSAIANSSTIATFTKINDIRKSSGLTSASITLPTGKAAQITISAAGAGYLNDPIYFTNFYTLVSGGGTNTVTFNAPAVYNTSTGEWSVNGTTVYFTGFSQSAFTSYSSYTPPTTTASNVASIIQQPTITNSTTTTTTDPTSPTVTNTTDSSSSDTSSSDSSSDDSSSNDSSTSNVASTTTISTVTVDTSTKPSSSATPEDAGVKKISLGGMCGA